MGSLLQTFIELAPVLLPLVVGCFDNDNAAAFTERLADEEDCARLLAIGCRMARRKLADDAYAGADRQTTFEALDKMEAALAEHGE